VGDTGPDQPADERQQLTLMDIVWEYAAAYGGPPRASDSWALFCAGAVRCTRFTARQLYHAMMGPSFALAGLSSEGAGSRTLMTEELSRLAFGSRSRLLTP